MATSARASGSYFGSPENFARRYSGGYFWYASSRSASACSARAAARSPATWARNARGITSLPYRCSRSFDHRHQRLTGVTHHPQQRAPQRQRVGLGGQHLRQRLPGGQEVRRVAARGTPQLLLVVRAEGAVVLDDERVVQIPGRVAGDGDAVDERRIRQVGRRKPASLRDQRAVGGLPVGAARVVRRPREGGCEGLRVERPSPPASCRPRSRPAGRSASSRPSPGRRRYPTSWCKRPVHERWCRRSCASRCRGRPRATARQGRSTTGTWCRRTACGPTGSRP